MSTSVHGRVWLAIHLLYPNSTQAFEIYQAVTASAEVDLLKKDSIYIFAKIAEIFEKIPAVGATLAFSAFPENQIEKWKLIYKKSQKIQTLIFVGVLVFNLELDKIAKIFSTPAAKIRYLFFQLFKNNLKETEEKKIEHHFHFKKKNEVSVSYLFTREYLIEYSLNQLDEKKAAQVKLGLSKFSNLELVYKEYSQLIGQIQYLLQMQNNFIYDEAPLVVSSEVADDRIFLSEEVIKNFKKHKTFITLAMSTGLMVLVVLMRPNWFEKISSFAKNKSITLQEVDTQKQTEFKVDSKNPTLSLNELPISRENKGEKPLAKSVPPPKATNVAVAKPANIVDEAPAPVKGKKQGGVFRGVLNVTDLTEVNPKIIEKMIALGAKKAGEVELGWKKSDKTTYYHFTLPENNLDLVKEYLSNFGSLKLQFENHPRMMPAGIKRFIIEVKESE